MKRALTPLSIGAMGVCLAVFFYAFSFPFTLWFTLRCLPRDCIPYVYEFYGPAHAIAKQYPPYHAILLWEARMLGLNPRARSAPASSP
jgi:hypothetical protein